MVDRTTHQRPIPSTTVQQTVAGSRPAPRVDSLTVIGSISTTAPATRMVVVDVWIEDDGRADHAIMNVVALLTTITTEHTKIRGGDRPETPVSIASESLAREGWRFSDMTTTTDVLIIHPELGEVVAASETFDSPNEAFRIVVAPWPADLDDSDPPPKRLAEAIKQAEIAAKAKIARHGYGAPSIGTAAVSAPAS